jgi:hypothetical protein
MQKLSAFKNCASLSQRRSATISRCINAIWAVGPPKDNSPILPQMAVDCTSGGGVFSPELSDLVRGGVRVKNTNFQ